MKNIKTRFPKLFACLAVCFLFSLTALYADRYDHDDHHDKDRRGHHGGWHGRGLHMIFEALEDANVSEPQENEIKALFENTRSENSEKLSGSKHSRKRGFLMDNRKALASLINQPSISQEELGRFYQEQVDTVLKDRLAARQNPYLDFFVGLHGILQADQRTLFVQSLKEELEERKNGSFFSRMFRKSPSERIESRITKVLDLTDAQAALLKQALPTEEETSTFRNLFFEIMETEIGAFEAESLSKENLEQSFSKSLATLREKSDTMAQSKFPAWVEFHAGLTEEQRKLAAEKLENPRHGKHKRGFWK